MEGTKDYSVDSKAILYLPVYIYRIQDRHGYLF